MKSVTIALMIAFSAVQTFAGWNDPVVGPKFTKIVKAEGFNERIQQAELIIGKSEISLKVFSNLCPKGVFCIAPPTVKEYRLPIVSKSGTNCGITFVAREDKRPVDGNFGQLIVKDMSTATCEIFTLSQVTVDGIVKGYDRIQGRAYESRFFIGLNK